VLMHGDENRVDGIRVRRWADQEDHRPWVKGVPGVD
jgi:hypothetical protein